MGRGKATFLKKRPDVWPDDFYPLSARITRIWICLFSLQLCLGWTESVEAAESIAIPLPVYYDFEDGLQGWTKSYNAWFVVCMFALRNPCVLFSLVLHL